MTGYEETRAAYLGEREVPLPETPFADYTPSDWALHYIASYGGIDGDHHKAWVLDQVTRILKGTPVEVTLAEWGPTSKHPEGQQNWRFNTGEPSEAYREFVKEACHDEETNDPDGYEWSVGIAP